MPEVHIIVDLRLPVNAEAAGYDLAWVLFHVLALWAIAYGVGSVPTEKAVAENPKLLRDAPPEPSGPTGACNPT